MSGSADGQERGPSTSPATAPLMGLVIVVALGLGVGALFGPTPGGWYDGLVKPAATPPGWVFPIAWTLLYAMTGLAAGLVWRAPAFTEEDAPTGRGRALGAFALQLLLNLAWTPIFFGAQALTAALATTVLLLLTALWAAVTMGRVDRRAGLLMAPYIVWVCFALYLTASIWSANA